MNIDRIKEILAQNLSKKRYRHSINVMAESEKLAKAYGCDINRALTAGLLHDCAKGLDNETMLSYCMRFNIHVDKICRVQPDLLHGAVGARLAKACYEVNDACILEAIRSHTMGEADMDILQKIIFLADYIEKDRSFEGVEAIRKEAYKDLNEALILAVDSTIRRVLGKKHLLHPNTVKMRNSIIESQIIRG